MINLVWGDVEILATAVFLVFVLEQLAVERRHAEEDRRTEALEVPEHVLRSRRVRVENRRCARQHGKIESVAEPVGEEQACRREYDVEMRLPFCSSSSVCRYRCNCGTPCRPLLYVPAPVAHSGRRNSLLR